MKTIRVLLCTLFTVTGLSLLSIPATARAADEKDQALAQRLDRLEQQVHQLAEREQPSDQRPGPMMPRDGRMQYQQPNRWHRHGCCILVTLLVVLAIVHVLLAIWVFGDIRKRGEGSGIFIVLALLIGVPGTVLYLLARIGDRKTT